MHVPGRESMAHVGHPTARRRVAKPGRLRDNTAAGDFFRRGCGMKRNFILATVFLVAGLVMLVVTLAMGDRLRPIPVGGGVAFAPGWVWLALLVLAAWNLLRWWISPRRPARDPLREALEARRYMHRAEERPQGPPDPTFNFTDPPPPAPEPHRTEPPPPAG
jgi:hypothetical protein